MLQVLGLALARYLALVSMCVWLGGFTFYSAIVIPTLHEEYGGLEGGTITGIVTNPLNAIGAAAVLAWWTLLAAERGRGERWARAVRLALMIATTAILAGLFAMHPVLETHLDEGSMKGFYALHQVYLVASTAQWGVNLALLAVTVWLWRPAIEPRATG